MATLTLILVAVVASVGQGSKGPFVAGTTQNSQVALMLLQRGASFRPTVSLKAYVYPPDDIQMFHSCWKGGSIPSDVIRGKSKHNVDYFFTKHILSDNFKGVPAEEAELFIVPGLCSQSAYDRCDHSHMDNVQQLYDYLASTEWFRRNGGRDHFLMCDKHDAYHELTRFASLGNLILGTFESNWGQEWPLHWRGRTVGVGYTTFAAFSMCTTPRFKAWRDRDYDIQSVFGMSPSDPKSRNRLLCAILQNDHDSIANGTQKLDKNLIFVRIADDLSIKCDDEFAGAEEFLDESAHAGRFSFEWPGSPHGADYNHHDCNGFDSMAASRISLSLKGDTPTTERFIDAFVQQTPVAILSNQRSAILERLPFGEIVPWSSLLVDVDDEEWDRSPLQALGLAKLNISEATWLHLVEKMRKHRDDVLWHTPQSRAADNVLREAIAVAKQTVVSFHATKDKPANQ